MKEPHEIIDQLSPADALAVLKTLAHEDETIAARAAEIATACLRDVDLEDVAFALYEELEFLEVEEVWDRAGPTRHGYVDPGEAADEMVDEIVAPYLDELRKLHALGMTIQANQMCMGLLLGLYRFERESTSEFKDWAPDAPNSFAWIVLDAWKEGSPARNDVRALKTFIEDRLGGWSASYL